MQDTELGLMAPPAVASLLTALRMFAPGWAWHWTWSETKPSTPGWAAHCIRLGECLALSLGINGLLGLLLSALGWFNPVGLHGGCLLLTLLGWGVGRWRNRSPRDPLAAVATFALLWLPLLVLPLRTDWIVGGRDPGLYLGEGVRLARTGTFSPAGDSFLRTLSLEDRSLFCADRFGFPEILPVVPVDPETQGERTFFFPLTSVLVGGLALDGGLENARRFPWMQCLFTGFVLAGFLARLGLHGASVIAGAAAWFAQPVVAYHANLPLSEFTEIILALFAMQGLGREGRGPQVWAGLFLLLAVSNRLSFLLFGGLMQVLWAARGDAPGPRVAPLLRLVGWLGLGLGTLVAMATSPYALLRLDGQAREVLGFGFSLFGLHLLLLVVPPLRRLAERIPDVPALFLASAALLVLALSRQGKMDRILLALDASGPFTGWAPFLIGLAGVAAYLLTRSPGPAILRISMLYFAVVTAMILTRFEIATDFPWASRRYLLCLSPLLVLGTAHVAGLLAARFRRGWLLILPLLLIPLGLSWRQAPSFPREYQSLSQVLADLARTIPPQALVICDHFAWATPLRLLHGIQTLDGERIREQESYAKAIPLLLASGRPVWLLTSVPEGHAWINYAHQHARPAGPPVHLAYSVMKAHRNVRGFIAEPKAKAFQLHVLDAAEPTP